MLLTERAAKGAALTKVDVPGAESERPRCRLLLVIKRRARQIEVHLVLAGLLLLSWKKSDPEPGVIARQERNAVLGVVAVSQGTNYTSITISLGIIVMIGAVIAVVVASYFRLQRHRADAAAMAASRRLSEAAVASPAGLIPRAETESAWRVMTPVPAAREGGIAPLR